MNQWIILELALLASIIQSGINMVGIYNVFIAAMAVTSITRAVVSYSEERKFKKLQSANRAYQKLLKELIYFQKED